MSSIFFALATLKARLQEADKERGATAVEYGLLVALIAAVIVAMVALVGKDVLTAFTTIEGALP